jgi:hypothetical protein
MDKQLIDDAFYIEPKSWGTYQSHYPDGKGIVTSLTEEECIRSTRWFLKLLQEESNGKKIEAPSYSGEMDYKL